MNEERLPNAQAFHVHGQLRDRSARLMNWQAFATASRESASLPTAEAARSARNRRLCKFPIFFARNHWVFTQFVLTFCVKSREHVLRFE